MDDAGSIAALAENRKRLEYTNLSECSSFLSFVVETLNHWGPQAKLLGTEVSDHLVEASSDQKAGSNFHQRISLAIERGNVASFLGTMPQRVDL